MWKFVIVLGVICCLGCKTYTPRVLINGPVIVERDFKSADDAAGWSVRRWHTECVSIHAGQMYWSKPNGEGTYRTNLRESPDIWRITVDEAAVQWAEAEDDASKEKTEDENP